MKLYVGRAMKKHERKVETTKHHEQKKVNKKHCTLFVCKLMPNANKFNLMPIFEEYGQVEDIHVSPNSSFKYLKIEWYNLYCKLGTSDFVLKFFKFYLKFMKLPI